MFEHSVQDPKDQDDDQSHVVCEGSSLFLDDVEEFEEEEDGDEGCDDLVRDVEVFLGEEGTDEEDSYDEG